MGVETISSHEEMKQMGVEMISPRGEVKQTGVEMISPRGEVKQTGVETIPSHGEMIVLVEGIVPPYRKIGFRFKFSVQKGSKNINAIQFRSLVHYCWI